MRLAIAPDAARDLLIDRSTGLASDATVLGAVGFDSVRLDHMMQRGLACKRIAAALPSSREPLATMSAIAGFRFRNDTNPSATGMK
jgi:hypothetical protein